MGRVETTGAKAVIEGAMTGGEVMTEGVGMGGVGGGEAGERKRRGYMLGEEWYTWLRRGILEETKDPQAMLIVWDSASFLY